MEFNERQHQIIEIVKKNEPITSENIANMLNVTRSALRSDLSILTMTEVLEARPKVGYFYTGADATKILSKHIHNVKISDILSIAIAVDEKTSVYDGIVTMFLEDVGSMFVLSDGYLAGVVSRKDFLKIAIGGGDINQMPLGMIMTRMPNIIMCEAHDTVYSAAKKIIEHQIDCLPVVKPIMKDGKDLYEIVGRISKTNLTNFLVGVCED